MTKQMFEPRKMMELAVEVMRKTVPENRDDGKVIPLVGAVLVKPDGTVDTAYRGELRDGNHAEFTLLDRKNLNQKLDGSVIFATLEPCAPGARRHPKLGCAEHIALARIETVWVGIEDPDPAVAGKGTAYLKEKGIEVCMFDRDLQEVILKENEAFIKQAQERAEAEKTKVKSEPGFREVLESPVAHSEFSDFDRTALEQYAEAVGISNGIDSLSFEQTMLQKGLLKHDGEINRPSGYGMLLFGKSPRHFFRQAGLLATAFHPDGTESIEEFSGPMVSVYPAVEKWLEKTLPYTIDRSRAQRVIRVDLPTSVIREAVINALIHRDYGFVGGKCQLRISSDTITVLSPGGPHPSISLKQMQSFDAPMVSRNPLLHFVFGEMDQAEERGLGMKTFRTLPQDHGLPLPKISMDGPYLALTIYRSVKSALAALPAEIRSALSKSEQDGWQYLSMQSTFNREQYEKHMQLEPRTAQRQLSHFVELGLLVRLGSGPSASYEVMRGNRDKNRDKLS